MRTEAEVRRVRDHLRAVADANGEAWEKGAVNWLTWVLGEEEPMDD